MSAIIGWDVGGAHLKGARAEGGLVTAAVQIPCPLWLGLGELDRAFAEAQAALGPAPLNALTMTGELSDAFETRADGVEGLATIAARLLAPGRVLIYAGAAGFVEPEAARAHALEIGSANWRASAQWAGLRLPEALFVDIGSSTADLIPIAAGAPAAMGATDAERLEHGELVYTGLSRTFLMAGPRRAPFAGRWTGMMNEWFADMADVGRILGRLPPEADTMDAPDGREKTPQASAARLARMIGRDSEEADAAAWRGLAAYFAEAQMREIMDAAFLILSRGALGEAAPILGAGVGRDIAAELARRLRRPFTPFDALIEATPEAREKAADCAPAAALALIASRQPAA